MIDVAQSAGWFAGAPWRILAQTSLAIVVVLLATKLLRRHPATSAWMWRLAVLKCLCALFVPLSFAAPLLNVSRGLPSVTSPADVVDSPADVGTSDTGRPIAEAGASTAPVDVAAGVAAPGAGRLLWIAWGVGAGFVALLSVRRVRLLNEVLRSTAPCVDPRIDPIVRELASRLRLRSPPGVRVTALCFSPFVAGWRHPVVVIPRWLLEMPDEGALRSVMAHELAHVRRRDVFWIGLASVVAGLMFFHPLVWLCVRRLRVSQECAADECALRLTGADPGDYARVLLETVARSRGAYAPRPLLSATGRSFQELCERVRTMQTFQRPQRSWVVTAFVCVLVVAGLVPWHPAERDFKAVAIEDSGRESVGDSADAAADRLRGRGATVRLLRLETPSAFVDVGTNEREEITLTIDDTFIKDLQTLAKRHELSISLVGKQMPAGTLAALAGVKDLAWLNLSRGPNLDPADLPKFPRLRKLSLRGKQYGDVAAQTIADNLTLLERADLRDTSITNDGLKELERLQKLTMLTLDGSEIDDEAADSFLRMPNLEFLELNRCAVGDPVAKAIGGCAKLWYLRLNDTKLTDVGVVEIARLKRLNVLQMWHCKGVTDASVPHLLKLPNTKESTLGLSIPATGITEAGARLLQSRMPHAFVSWSAPPVPPK